MFVCGFTQYWTGIEEQKVSKDFNLLQSIELNEENNLKNGNKISLMNRPKCNLKLRI